MITVKDILDISRKYLIKHIPSALSQTQYLRIILPFLLEERKSERIKICIGKPFGVQPYYAIFKKLKLLPKDFDYKPILDSNDFEFIDYTDTTMGNALGYAIGLNLQHKQKIWVNLSDATFQIGATIEALQYIGRNRNDILITIDYNNYQLNSKSFVTNYQIKMLCIMNDITVIEVDLTKENRFSLEDFKKIYYSNNGPKAIIFKTIKGKGVKIFEDDPIKYHYKGLECEKELQNF